ncbi:MAG: ECF-type sigma factor [Acidobacteriota bacterium]
MERLQAITEILDGLRGTEGRFDDLVPAVYDELRGLARSQLRRLAVGPRGGAIDTTELVHEAYLKLSDAEPRWQSRRHFFATASKVMRHILTDAARMSQAAKRGGDATHLPLCDSDAALAHEADTVLAIDSALEELAQNLPRLAQLVEYRFFGGLSEEEIAEIQGTSTRTVRRDWVKARAWLHRHLEKNSTEGSGETLSVG